MSDPTDLLQELADRMQTPGGRRWVCTVLRNHAIRAAFQQAPARRGLPLVLQGGGIHPDWIGVANTMDQAAMPETRVTRVSAEQAYGAWTKAMATASRPTKSLREEAGVLSDGSRESSLSRWSRVSEREHVLVRPGAMFPGMSIMKHAGMWRLSLKRAERPDISLWESDTPEECAGIAGTVASYERETARFLSNISRLPPSRPSRAIPGVILSCRSTFSDGRRVVMIEAFKPDPGAQPARIGWTGVEMTHLGARLVIGEPTVTGGSWIDDPRFRGRGLGREIYDLSADAAGFPRVPHGMNGNVGMLLEDSRRFWEKRKRHVRVPGLDDPVVAARLEQVQDRTRVLRLEKAECDPVASIQFAAAVALSTGWRLEGRFIDDAIYNVWCVTPVGQVFTSGGFFDREQFLARIVDRDSYLGNDVRPVTVAMLAGRVQGVLTKPELMDAWSDADIIHRRHAGSGLPPMADNDFDPQVAEPDDRMMLVA